MEEWRGYRCLRCDDRRGWQVSDAQDAPVAYVSERIRDLADSAHADLTIEYRINFDGIRYQVSKRGKTARFNVSGLELIQNSDVHSLNNLVDSRFTDALKELG